MSCCLKIIDFSLFHYQLRSLDAADGSMFKNSHVQFRDEGGYECQIGVIPRVSHYIHLSVVGTHFKKTNKSNQIKFPALEFEFQISTRTDDGDSWRFRDAHRYWQHNQFDMPRSAHTRATRLRFLDSQSASILLTLNISLVCVMLLSWLMSVMLIEALENLPSTREREREREKKNKPFPYKL